MSTILVITASPRGERSVSRALTTAFADLWAEHHPQDTILLRDIGHHPVPHVTEPWVVGAFAPAEAQNAESKAAISVSDQLVEEFLAADRYVFGVPMYNLNIPSTFKAYIDQIVRAGKDLRGRPQRLRRAWSRRKRRFSSPAAAAAYPPGTPMAAYNFQEPYLRAIFGFIGVTELQFVAADSMNQGEDAARHSREKAKNALKELAALMVNG